MGEKAYTLINNDEKVRSSEGINTLYKLSGMSLLLGMSRFRSISFVKVANQIRNVLKSFEIMLERRLNNPACAGYYYLKRSGLLKAKHYYYGAYLATLSSYPILYKTDEKTILDAIFAKTAAITSIKILDNIDDRIYERMEAVNSQKKHLEAFTEKDFEMPTASSFLSKVENSCFEIARWTFNIAQKGVPDSAFTWKIYLEDFQRYIYGQIKSMSGKIEPDAKKPTIIDYIQKINEKSVGRIWVDIDLCLLESAIGKLTREELYVTQNIRNAADYLFKGCNIYDDVADLEEDLSLNIMNSVILLAIDRGHIEERDLKRNKKELITKLKESGSISETVSLGDMIFFEGIKPLEEVKNINSLIDIDALIYGARILRAFAIRKWMLHERSIASFYDVMKSFGNHLNSRIPACVQRYIKYI